jgi:hypothetical protein
VFALLHVFFVFFWVSTSVFHLVTGVKPGKQSNQRSVKRQDRGTVFVVVVSLLTFLVDEGRQAGRLSKCSALHADSAWR